MYRTHVDRPEWCGSSDLSVKTHAKFQGSNLASPTWGDMLDEVVLENAHHTSSNLLAVNNKVWWRAVCSY